MANKTLKNMQYTNIVEWISKKANVSLDEALKMFYHSNIYLDLDEEIADFHCQGDLYIAYCIIDEYKEKENLK